MTEQEFQIHQDLADDPRGRLAYCSGYAQSIIERVIKMKGMPRAAREELARALTVLRAPREGGK